MASHHDLHRREGWRGLEQQPLAARAHIHPEDVPPAGIEKVEAQLTLQRLQGVFLETETGVHGATRAGYDQILADHVIAFFGEDFDVTRLRAKPSLALGRVGQRESITGVLSRNASAFLDAFPASPHAYDAEHHRFPLGADPLTDTLCCASAESKPAWLSAGVNLPDTPAGKEREKVSLRDGRR